jgi:cell division protein FtsI/penicillin-binding protein 2
LFLLVLMAAFLSLAGRCFYLQFFKSGYYSAVWINQRQGQIIEKPQRGTILDCRGRVLAASNKVQIVFADPAIIKDPEAVSSNLEPILSMESGEIYKLITESLNTRYAKLKVAAEADQCIAAEKIYGIGIDSDWKRYYPMGPLASNVVGFTSADNRGLEGIELKYDKKLSGSMGRSIFLADAFRRPVWPCRQQEGQGSRLTDGVGIILTLDATIQQFARAELIKQVEGFEAEYGVAIVADPKTGAILAMVSVPDFNPNEPGASVPDNLRNRAITDQFEPGSMIKPIVAAIAIDTGTISKDDRIFCENGNYYGKGFGRINEYKGHRYGELSVREVLIKSSNIGMAKIGQKMGKDKLYNGLKIFGFGKKTGVELPGEVEGLLRPTEEWSGYSVTRIPYGYEISVTTMQMLRAFCILANGGRSVRPYLVKAIVGNDGQIIKLNQPPPPVGFIIKPEVARWIVNDCLVGVVNEKENGGTGWRAKLEKWQVFGKTGTANIARVGEKGYEDNTNLASFVAGAPAEDPAIIVLVSIRKPNSRLGKGDSGGAVASPVAARIIEKTLTYLEKRSRL